MNKIFSAVFASASFFTFCSAQELVLNCETQYQVRGVSVHLKDCVRLEKGKGRNGGNAFRIFHPGNKGTWKNRNAGFRGEAQIKVKSTSKPVCSQVYLKGKGTVFFGILAYDRQRKIFYPPGLIKKYRIDSPDQWYLLKFSYTPDAGTRYANQTAYIMPYITIAPGSDLLLDDWETRFIDDNAEIIIEE